MPPGSCSACLLELLCFMRLAMSAETGHCVGCLCSCDTPTLRRSVQWSLITGAQRMLFYRGPCIPVKQSPL